jgi:branched-chain amino acid aminotransferase
MGNVEQQGMSRFEAMVIPGSMEPVSSTSLDWDKIGFSVTVTPFMSGSVAGPDGVFEKPVLLKTGSLKMAPWASSLNYGQALFEGMKARKGVDGKIRLFRMADNIKRMGAGAERMMLAAPPAEVFRKAVIDVVKANKDYIPPLGKGSLYIRPLLVGAGMTLAPSPSDTTLFVVYVQPVGSYFKGLSCIAVRAEEQYQRAAAKGTGWVKAAGNYAPCFLPGKKAKADGFADTLFLDQTGVYVEEVGAANFAMVKNGTLYIADSPSILNGITRDSLRRIAREALGIEVVFAPLKLDRVLGSGEFSGQGPADEAFCTGTAAVISPIGSMTFRDRKYVFGIGEVGSISAKLFDHLDGIQTGRLPDPYGWTEVVE